MSYTDRPELTFWQKLGCFIYMVGGAFIMLAAFGIAILGGCPAFAPRSCEPAEQWILNAIFPGAVVLVFLGGYGMLRFFKRDRT